MGEVSRKIFKIKIHRKKFYKFFVVLELFDVNRAPESIGKLFQTLLAFRQVNKLKSFQAK